MCQLCCLLKLKQTELNLLAKMSNKFISFTLIWCIQVTVCINSIEGNVIVSMAITLFKFII